MIRYFRDNIQGGFAKVFVALISIPFVLFGAESIFNTQGEPKVAKVDGEGITQSALDRELQRIMNQIAQMQGENFDPNSVDVETYRPTAIDNLVNRELVKQLAEDQKLAISVNTADAAIVDQTAFHVDGKFSADMYKNLLRNNGLTPTAYKALVVEDLLFNQANSAVATGSFVTEAEVDDRIKLDFETRDLSYIVVPKTAGQASVVVEESEVEQFYADNSDSFMTEEKLAVDYVELSLQDFFSDVADQDLQQAYDSHIAEMVLPTQREAAHILIEFDGDEQRAAAEASLLEAKARIEAGEDFAVLAAEMSDDIGSAEQGGNLGYTSGELFPQAFEDALAALEQGTVSEPVETEAGLHLIKLLNIEVSDKPSFDDLKPMLTEQLQRLQASEAFEQQLETLRDLAFDSDAIADVAAELEDELQNSGKFTQDGAISGLFANPKLVATAFGDAVRLDKRISDVIEISADQYLVMQLSALDEPQLKPYEQVSAQIKKQLFDEKAAEALQQKVDALLAKVQEGQALAAIAEEESLEVSENSQISRREPGEADRQVVNQAFSTAVEGDAASDLMDLRNGDVALFVVSNVNEGDIAKVDEQQRESIKRLLMSVRGREEGSAFLQALNDRADVDIF